MFKASVSPSASAVEPVTICATVAGAARSTTVKIDPTPKFSFQGNTTELSLLANGALVQATVNPVGWLGTLTVRGRGYIAIDPVSGTDGVSFHTGGGQNVNTAFVNFTGAGLGNVINNSSEVSFLLKSAYSFTERKALPASNLRAAFEIFDNTQSWCGFNTYTSSTGQLQFSFAAQGYSAVYTVPAGQEDAIFGKGVIARIRITWNASSFNLYVNDVLAQSTPVPAVKTPNWSSLSAFTIGSRSTRLSGGGYYASDDAIADFMMR